MAIYAAMLRDIVADILLSLYPHLLPCLGWDYLRETATRFAFQIRLLSIGLVKGQCAIRYNAPINAQAQPKRAEVHRAILTSTNFRCQAFDPGALA